MGKNGEGIKEEGKWMGIMSAEKDTEIGKNEGGMGRK